MQAVWGLSDLHIDLLQVNLYTFNWTHLYNPRWDDSQYEVEPNVGKNTPESRNKKHSQVLDLARLPLRDHPDTQTDYHKHIEGSAAHYSARAQLPCIKVVPTHLRKIQWTKREKIEQTSHKKKKPSKNII